MDTHFTYAALHVGAFTFPFLLSFDRKVAFFRKWRYLFPAIFIVAAGFIVWDIYFTKIGVWSFNDNYITGWRLVNLPWEEVLFFFTIPYCCLFIYECVVCYFPQKEWQPAGQHITLAAAIITGVTGVIFYDNYYTSWSGIIASVLLFFTWWKRYRWTGRFWISYVIVLLPFFICNGILTAKPVVIYNDAENVGVRMYTIPVEDLMYNLIMLLGVTILYEKFRGGNTSLQKPASAA